MKIIILPFFIACILSCNRKEGQIVSLKNLSGKMIDSIRVKGSNTDSLMFYNLTLNEVETKTFNNWVESGPYAGFWVKMYIGDSIISRFAMIDDLGTIPRQNNLKIYPGFRPSLRN